MQITSSFKIKNADFILEASSSFNINTPLSSRVLFASTSILDITESFKASGNSMLQPLASIGGIIPVGYGVSSSSLPALVSSGEGGFYIPPTLEEGYVTFKPLYSSGFMTMSSPGDGQADIPSCVSVGGEGAYGLGSTTLSPMTSAGYEGKGEFIADCISYALSLAPIESIFGHVVFINSSGQVLDTISGTREVIVSLLSSASLSDNFEIIGSYLASIDSFITGLFSTSASVNGAPSLNSDARVWVVNAETGASSQYENYGFNSFYEDDGKYYGVADDGIYLLDGSTDEGFDIDALVEFARSDFGLSKKKTVPNVYLGVSSTNKVLLKVEADGRSYTYEASSSSEVLKTHRVTTGKGLNGNYFSFTLLNEGGDFDLESITFSPIQMSRKI